VVGQARTFFLMEILFAIGQSGEHLEIRNDARFAPTVW
jgi:hypothetical protein